MMKSLANLLPLLLILFVFSCKTETKEPMADPVEKAPVKEWAPEDTRSITGYFSKRGLFVNTEKATPGYILFQPSSSTKTYLMNKQGEVVHSWPSDLNSMQSYLKENGNLVRLERDPDFPVFAAGGQSGRIREYTWDGEIVWDFEYATDKYLTHHDIELLPNGNILAISYDAKTKEEAIAAGRDPEHVLPGGLWPDKIIEIEPTKPNGGKIVWEWRMWDHLVQDKFPDKANYGQLKDHPRKININVIDEHSPPPPPAEQIEQMKKMGWVTSNASADTWGADITHTNAISYNPKLDQIAISIPGYCEIFIIDHSTTTEEAKGSTGGRWGHGGDLLYRWGNPQNYGRGGKQDQVLYSQHDIRWIEDGRPGAGNLTVFNNDIPGGKGKLPSAFAVFMEAKSPDPQVSIADVDHYSAVYEFTPKVDKQGAYELSEGGSFEPAKPEWTYTAPDYYSFYSPFVSCAERLSDGHTLILSGAKGRIFEIDEDKEIVWEYWQPYFDDYKLPDGSPAQPSGPFIFSQFRVKQYSPDYPGLQGKELMPLQPQPQPFVPQPMPKPAAAE